MSGYTYNEFIGPETLFTEYKEFSFFKSGFFIDSTQTEMYCKTNTFDFTELVRSSLEMYITQYVPRYVSSFWNGGIENGNLYFGVNDYGMVKGIPIKNANKEELFIWLQKTIGKCKAKCISKKYKKNISITFDLIPVSTPPMPSTDLHPDYIEYTRKKEEFEDHYRAFLQVYEDWKQRFSIVNCKLVDIVNIPKYRVQLQEFIREMDPSNSIIKLLDTDFMLEYKSGDEMRSTNFNETNPYYWVTLFKDKWIDEYKKAKPVFTEIFYKNVPYNLMIGGEMIPYWMNYNTDMHLYIIKINIELKPTLETMYYYDNVCNKNIKCKRVMDKGQPVCIPF